MADIERIIDAINSLPIRSPDPQLVKNLVKNPFGGRLFNLCAAENLSAEDDEDEIMVDRAELDAVVGTDDGNPERVMINGRMANLRGLLTSDTWNELIHKLDNIEPMEKPLHFLDTPHEWQSKGAAQLHYLCTETLFKGGILGDGMGVGKTHQGILLEWLARHEPGMTLIITPASLLHQWKNAFQRAWPINQQRRVFILDNPKTSAQDLLNANYDVILCSYGFVQSSYARLQRFKDGVQAYSEGKAEKLPERWPTCALHSGLWKMIQLPWKRVILDEAQYASKRELLTHEAIKNLYYKSIVLMSGTIADNWHDISGLVHFLRGHPFDNHSVFMAKFGRKIRSGQYLPPDNFKTKLLQLFLLPFTIARPPSLLNLQVAQRRRVGFNLEEIGFAETIELMEKFLQAFRRQVARKKEQTGGSQAKNSKTEHIDVKREANPLRYVAEAHMMSINPILRNWVQQTIEQQSRKANGEYYDAEFNPIEDLDAKGLKEAANDRKRWLSFIHGSTFGEAWRSPRIETALKLYQWLQTQYPDESIVVFSEYVKALDLLHLALRSIEVEPLRFDGTISPSDREKVKEEFSCSDPRVPLLVTSGAGGAGIELHKASHMILLEVCWNENTEARAIFRLHRQGQPRQVYIYRLFGFNSASDHYILHKHSTKTDGISSIMRGLVRRHDEPANIPFLPKPGAIYYDLDPDPHSEAKEAKAKAEAEARAAPIPTSAEPAVDAEMAGTGLFKESE